MRLVKTTVTLDEFHVQAIEDVCKRMGLKKAEFYRYAVLFMLRANTGMNIPFPSKILDEMRYVGSIMVNRATADGPMPPDVPDLPIPLHEEPEPEPAFPPEPRFPVDLWKSLTVAPMEASRDNAPPPFPEPRGLPAEYLPLDEYQPSSTYSADMILYIRTYFSSLTEEEQEHLWNHMQLYVENPYHREVIDKFIAYVAGMIYYRMYYEFPHFCPSCEAIGRKTSWTEWYANDHFTYEPRPDGKYDCGPCVARGARWDK